jgi:hypothetical protein
MPTTRENIKISPKYRHISHLLRRAGFGATPGEMDRYMGMDYSEVVDELLNVSAKIDDHERLYITEHSRARIQVFDISDDGL